MEKSASSNGTMDNVLYKPVETAKYDNIEEKIATSTSQDAMMECRSCLAGVQEDAWVDIFCPWSPPWSGMGLSMAEDLAKLAGIQISVSDPHSKIICKTCCTMLQNAINFMLNVQNSDMILRKRLKDSFTEASLWPKPIQIYNNIANEVLQEMEIEIDNIKQEVASDDEFDNNDACNELSDTRLETLDIKIEPEEITKQNILFEYKRKRRSNKKRLWLSAPRKKRKYAQKRKKKSGPTRSALRTSLPPRHEEIFIDSNTNEQLLARSFSSQPGGIEITIAAEINNAPSTFNPVIELGSNQIMKVEPISQSSSRSSSCQPGDNKITATAEIKALASFDPAIELESNQAMNVEPISPSYSRNLTPTSSTTTESLIMEKENYCEIEVPDPR